MKDYNLCTWEVETRDLKVQGHFKINGQVKAMMSYIKLLKQSKI